MLSLKPKQIICVVLTTVVVALVVIISLSVRSSARSSSPSSNDVEASQVRRSGHNLWNDTPYVHIPNTYCNNYYETGNDETCENGDSFDDIWKKCQNDGDKCMGVQWNSCDQSDTSNIGVSGAWKLLSAGQHIGDSENPTEDCGGKEQALGHWDIFVKKSAYYKDLPIHIPNTYCAYYEWGGDGQCEDGISFNEAWEKCLNAENSKCMGVMWNSCEGSTSDISVNGAWKLMTAGQTIGDAHHPTDTCGGKEQALGHWDVFVRESMYDEMFPPEEDEEEVSYIEVTSDTCETHGYEVVNSKDECSAAATDLGLTIIWGPHGGYSDVVTGCSVRSRNQLFYNPPGICVPTHNEGQWTHTGCKCTRWMPCICRVPQEVPQTGSCKADQTKVEISITTDNYPSETTWTVEKSNGEVVATSESYSGKYSTDISEVLCLGSLTTCHRFTIMDTYGDGLIKGGGFSVKVDNAEVLSNLDGTPFSSLHVNIGECTAPTFHVQSNDKFPEAEEGKIAILSKNEVDFWFKDLGYAHVSDGKDIFQNSHIKQNQGFIVLAKNLRTEREGGLMVWTNSDVAYGSWNPKEFSKADDWKEGDEIALLLDQYDEVQSRGFARDDCTYKAVTGTGWRLPADSIRLGQSGLVGPWWRELEIEYEFKAARSIGGVWSDSMNLPYSIKYETNDGTWVVLHDDCKGAKIFSTPVLAKKWRLSWESTNLFETGGLSTYRGGGGLHAELLLY